jgi:hypothetical protein
MNGKHVFGMMAVDSLLRRKHRPRFSIQKGHHVFATANTWTEAFEKASVVSQDGFAVVIDYEAKVVYKAAAAFRRGILVYLHHRYGDKRIAA